MRHLIAVAALAAAFSVALLPVIAQPASAAEQATYIDEMAFAAHPKADAGFPYEDPFPGLPPASEWVGDIRACDADHNPPEWMTRFGGFCQQTANKAKMSLLYTGADLIFGFKGN